MHRSNNLCLWKLIHLLIEALYETVYSFETTGGFEGGVFEAVGLVFWGFGAHGEHYV